MVHYGNGQHHTYFTKDTQVLKGTEYKAGSIITTGFIISESSFRIECSEGKLKAEYTGKKSNSDGTILQYNANNPFRMDFEKE